MTTKRSQSPDAAFLCQQTFADDRRCRMLRKEHPYLCPFHARQREQRRQAKELQDEILSLQYRLTTAADIHHVISKVFDAAAQTKSLPAWPASLAISAKSCSNPCLWPSANQSAGACARLPPIRAEYDEWTPTPSPLLRGTADSKGL